MLNMPHFEANPGSLPSVPDVCQSVSVVRPRKNSARCMLVTYIGVGSRPCPPTYMSQTLATTLTKLVRLCAKIPTIFFSIDSFPANAWQGHGYGLQLEDCVG